MPLQTRYYTNLQGLPYVIIKGPKPYPSNKSGRFTRGMVVLWTGDLFFLIIKCINLRETILSGQQVKHHLYNLVADSILYKFGESSLYNISPKAKIHAINPGDFRVA
jgi:hypothetical protein